MRKSILLCVLAIAALVAAGFGGTLAGVSDIELAANNVLEVGNLDLKVANANPANEADDNSQGYLPWSPLVQAAASWPSRSQDFTFYMHSKSEPAGKVAYAYIRFKDYQCSELYTTQFPFPNRPEPKDVAEKGGWLANTQITSSDALGPLGQNGTLANYIEVVVQFDADPNTPRLETVLPLSGKVYMSDIDGTAGKWIRLGQILAGQTRQGKISVKIGSHSEDEFKRNLFDKNLPFHDWPTNAFMNDKITFNIEFALTQDPIPDSYLINH